MSSKGFPVSADGVTEAGAALELVSPDITEALLVSAYDLHHKLLPDCDRFLGPDHHQTIYGTPKLLVVDSGGYELNSSDFESGETKRDPYRPGAFTREQFEELADRLPKDRELLVVSYDSPDRPRGSYRNQRETAQRFFASRTHLSSDFLLKPEHDEELLDVAALTTEAPNLRGFNVIGVTEKELGDTLLDRLLLLARLRELLDDKGCAEIPVHVFGSLDPLLTPLYFMAGAEIFDGLSWLRYAYIDGLSAHPEQLAVLQVTIEDRLERRNLYRWLSNIQRTHTLRNSLARWAQEPDRYEHLGPQHETLRQIYETMRARLTQRG